MPGFPAYGGDPELPDPSLSNNTFWGKNLVDAVNNGSVPVSRLDDMVTRTFAAYYKLGQDKGYPAVNFDVNSPGDFNNGVLTNEHVKYVSRGRSVMRRR